MVIKKYERNKADPNVMGMMQLVQLEAVTNMAF